MIKKEVILEKPELYNLEIDIGEKYDLAETYPEKVAELEQRLQEHIEDTKDR